MDFDHAEGVFSDDEARWRPLWQAYFAAIAVRTRLNPRLQRQYMPRRYWHYLVEEPGSSRRLAPPGGRGRS
jgi:probable DNA metabolism protein